MNYHKILLLLGLLIWSYAPISAQTSVSVTRLSHSDRLPAVHLATMEGKSVSSTDLHYPLLISVFTTWCKVCKVELDDLEKDYRLIQRDTLPVSVVAINAGEKAKTVQKYLQRKNLTFPVLLDSRLELVRAVDIKGTPTILLFDKDQKLVYQGTELPKNWVGLLK